MKIAKREKPFEDEWEKEMNKWTKDDLIKMIRKLQTGTEDKKLCQIESSKDANIAVEGIINDFEAGISTKEETMRLMGEYTGRLMEVFWKNALKKFTEGWCVLEKKEKAITIS